MGEAGGVAVHDPKVEQHRLPVAQALSPFTVYSCRSKAFAARLLPGRCCATLWVCCNARHCRAAQSGELLRMEPSATPCAGDNRRLSARRPRRSVLRRARAQRWDGAARALTASGSGLCMALVGAGSVAGPRWLRGPVWASADGCRSAVVGEGVQLAEQAPFGCDEFVEGALFPDAAVVEDDDPVGHAYVVEAVGDHDGDPVGGHGA